MKNKLITSICMASLCLSSLQAKLFEQNPVTGKNEVRIVSEDKEIALGKEYMPKLIQMNGGRYVCYPAVQEYVEEVGQKLVKVTKRKELAYEFVVINDTVPNAFTLPGGKVMISRGLLELLQNEGQLAAVLAHEIVHAAARHGAKNQERAGMWGALTEGLAAAGGWAALAALAVTVASPVSEASYSRHNEREADMFGMHYMYTAGYNPKAMIEMQQLFLDLEKKKEVSKSKGLLASHPATVERLNYVKNYLNKFEDRGTFGVEKYQRIMGKLIQSKDAYKVMVDGYKAFAKKEFTEAQTLAEKALVQCPNEPHFHALLGRCYLEQKEYDKALAEFNTAVAQNDDYFKYHFFRGLALKGVGKNQLAKKNFVKSYEIFPSPDAKKMMS